MHERWQSDAGWGGNACGMTLERCVCVSGGLGSKRETIAGRRWGENAFLRQIFWARDCWEVIAFGFGTGIGCTPSYDGSSVEGMYFYDTGLALWLGGGREDERPFPPFSHLGADHQSRCLVCNLFVFFCFFQADDKRSWKNEKRLSLVGSV